MKLVLDLDKLVTYPLNLVQIFLLHCVRYDLGNVINSYVKVEKVGFDNIRYLIQRGYLSSKDKNEPIPLTFSKLAITNKGIEFLTELSEHDSSSFTLFNTSSEKPVESFAKEFAEVYPKKIGARYLHANSKQWMKKYDSIVKGDKAKHDMIIDCVKLMVRDLKVSNSETYYPMVATYLNQERWQAYEDQVKEMHKQGQRVDSVVSNSAEGFSGYGTTEF